MTRPACGVAALLLLLCAATASAQDERRGAGLAAFVGSGLRGEDLGISAGLGAALIAGAVTGRAFAEVQLRADDGSGYRWEVDSSGATCRDVHTGARVEAAQCSVAHARVGGSAEVTQAVSGRRGALHAGAGVAAGIATTPYAVLGYEWRPGDGERRLAARAVAGRRLVELQVQATVRVTRRR